MDASALDALIATYRAHAEPRLLTLLIEAGAETGHGPRILPLLESLDAGAFADGAIRRKAVGIALGEEVFGLARRLLGDAQEPEDLLLEARCLLGIDDRDGALAAYRRAIAANPAIEDVELEKSLTRPGASQEPVNVISFAGRRAERTQGAKAGMPPMAASVLPSAAERAAKAITFEDVGGLDEVKAQIRRRIIMPYLKPSLFERFKRKAGGGVMLYGPPGCGKTMLARATAGECKARFISIHISEILDMYLGQSEKRLSAAFEEARRETPAVLFFDEIEALAARRRYGSHDSSATLVSAFLSELDGFQQNNAGVLVLAATNVPWAVDAAFRRPGRFDRVVFVPPPDVAARAGILASLTKDMPGAGGLSLDKIVPRTSGFSGADLKHLVETAADLAIEESLEGGRQSSLTFAHLEAALEEVKPTTVEWLTTARNYSKYANTGGQYDEVAAFLDKHSR